MSHLAPHDIMVVFRALAVLLATAKICGELVKKFNQPAVLGEIIAGILLGPTLLGRYEPAVYSFLFPLTGPAALVLDGVVAISVVFFLLTAGIEIDLASIFRQGKSALLVSSFGIVIPFAFGFVTAFLLPQLLGAGSGGNRLVFSLFIGTALSISALPVVARILIDLGLLNSDMGTIVMSSAMFDDLVGWILFGMILGMMNPGAATEHSIRHTIFLVLTFAVLMLTVGRWLIHKTLPFIQAHTSWPGGVLGFIFSITWQPLPSPNLLASTLSSAHSLPVRRSANQPTCGSAPPSTFMKLSPMCLLRCFLPASACTQISSATSMQKWQESSWPWRASANSPAPAGALASQVWICEGRLVLALP